MAKKKQNQTVFAHITIGMQMAITILIFVYGGYLLDQKYHKSPLFVALGVVVGMILGFYQLIRELKRIEEREERSEKSSSEKDKNKRGWM